MHNWKVLSICFLFVFFIQVGTASYLQVINGTGNQSFNGTEYSTTSTTSIPLSNLTISQNVSGSFVFYFNYKTNANGYWQMYKNNVAYSTEFQYIADTNWHVRTERKNDTILNTSDIIELRCRGVGGSTCYVDDFKLEYDYVNVTVLTPVNNSGLASRNINISWTYSSPSPLYQYQVSQQLNFSTLLFNSSTPNNYSGSLTVPSGINFIRVFGINSTSDGYTNSDTVVYGDPGIWFQNRNNITTLNYFNNFFYLWDNSVRNITYNWNGTNYTIRNESLVLALDFDNISLLGDNSTNVADTSIYKNNGTSAMYPLDYPQGHMGYGYNVTTNQADSYHNVSGSAINLPYGNNSSTISVWFNSRGINASSNVLFGYGSLSTGNARYLFLPNATRFGCIGYSADLTAAESEATGGMPNHSVGWHNAVCEYNGTNTIIYFDGKFRRSAARTYNTTPNTLYTVGNFYGPAVYYDFPGIIDEVRVWNRTLSTDEIAFLYNSTLQKLSNETWYITANHSNLVDRNVTYTFNASYTNLTNASFSTETKNITYRNTSSIIKYSGNPILSPGAPGSWDDYAVREGRLIMEGNGSVKRGPDGKYWMYYRGETWNTSRPQTGFLKYDKKIGLAKSDDLLSWTKYGNNPLNLSISNFSGYNLSIDYYNEVGDPYVYYRNDTNLYYLFYLRGVPYFDFNVSGVWVATSVDGINWTDGGQNPLRNETFTTGPDSWVPVVIYENNTWKLWTATGTGIGIAVRYFNSNNSDPTRIMNWTFVRNNQTAGGGAAGSGASGFTYWANREPEGNTACCEVGFHTMWKYKDFYYATTQRYIDTADDTGDTLNIGLTRSADGIYWNASTQNPILYGKGYTEGHGGDCTAQNYSDWDGCQNHFPYSFLDNNTFKIIYTGGNGTAYPGYDNMDNGNDDSDKMWIGLATWDNFYPDELDYLSWLQVESYSPTSLTPQNISSGTINFSVELNHVADTLKWTINNSIVKWDNLTFSSWMNSTQSFGLYNVSMEACGVTGCVYKNWTWTVTSGASNITSWYNNNSGWNNTTASINISVPLLFNVTVNQTVINVSWKVNGTEEQNTSSLQFIKMFATNGNHNVTAQAFNTNGSSNIVYTNVSVTTPPSIVGSYSYNASMGWTGMDIEGNLTNVSATGEIELASILKDYPQHLIRLNEGTGVFTDENRTHPMTNGCVFNGVGTPINGLKFINDSDGITCPNDYLRNLTSWTIGIDVKPNLFDANNRALLAISDNSPANAFKILIVKNNRFYPQVLTNTVYAYTNTVNNLVAGTQYYLINNWTGGTTATSFNNTINDVYSNSQKVSGGATVRAEDATNLTIGHKDGNMSFRGEIYELWIFPNASLSRTERSQMYTHEKVVRGNISITHDAGTANITAVKVVDDASACAIDYCNYTLTVMNSTNAVLSVWTGKRGEFIGNLTTTPNIVKINVTWNNGYYNDGNNILRNHTSKISEIVVYSQAYTPGTTNPPLLSAPGNDYYRNSSIYIVVPQFTRVNLNFTSNQSAISSAYHTWSGCGIYNTSTSTSGSGYCNLNQRGTYSATVNITNYNGTSNTLTWNFNVTGRPQIRGVVG